MRVDTHPSAREEVWRPSPETASAPKEWQPEKSSRGKRTLLIIAIVAGALVVLGGFLSLLDGSDEAVRPADEKVVVPQEPGPSQKELRARYAGRYDNAAGKSIWLNKNGSYTIEGYMQVGGSDLEWIVKRSGRIFVMTYYSSVAGRVDFSGRTYDIRKGGKVLVQIHPKTGRPFFAGERYTKVSK